jgi:nucleoside-diphosphate-sugar epimerase
MNVLITGAASRLGRAAAEALEPDHRLRLLDEALDSETRKVCVDAELVEGSILDAETAQKATCGMDAVIHTGEPPADLTDDELERETHLLDLATRGTYTLFTAAVEAGVHRLIYVSTLAMFGAYPDDVYVTENFRPLPTTDMGQMGPYLGEQVSREFARENLVTVTVLRLGKLVLEEEVIGLEPDPMWLDLRDAAGALRLALAREAGQAVRWTRRFGVYHISAAIRNPKFLMLRQKGPGYEPKHNFQENWG